jgi:hypothetical protein
MTYNAEATDVPCVCFCVCDLRGSASAVAASISVLEQQPRGEGTEAGRQAHGTVYSKVGRRALQRWRGPCGDPTTAGRLQCRGADTCTRTAPTKPALVDSRCSSAAQKEKGKGCGVALRRFPCLGKANSHWQVRLHTCHRPAISTWNMRLTCRPPIRCGGYKL